MLFAAVMIDLDEGLSLERFTLKVGEFLICLLGRWFVLEDVNEQ
jgi:hypothetical protein